jgi:phosphoglycerol transferase MdoB-like AlkP superfamily enzyme
METLMSICLGIGLSAACGFRVFVPLLVMSLASFSGHLTLAHGFEWIGTYPALLAFSVATCLEIAGYYIPWIDHLLDTIATPAAIVAGTVITASMVSGMSPLLKWTLAAMAGGGVAGLVQGATMAARGASTLTTGGLANPLVSTLELVGALVTSVLALLAPLLVVVLITVFLVFFGRKLLRKMRTARPVPPAIAPAGNR